MSGRIGDRVPKPARLVGPLGDESVSTPLRQRLFPRPSALVVMLSTRSASCSSVHVSISSFSEIVVSLFK